MLLFNAVPFIIKYNYILWRIYRDLICGLAIDICTVFNSKQLAGEISGILIALAGYVGLMICKIVVLIRFRKNTEKFCGMRISTA